MRAVEVPAPLRVAATVALVLLIGLLLAACSEGNRTAPTLSRADDGANGRLTPAQVAPMVPTRRELHLPLWGVMQPAEREGGPMDNRRAAKETALWNVTRSDLDAAGRIGGYVVYFWDGGCGGTCLARPLLTLRTEAHIFSNGPAASRFMRASASHYRAQNGHQLRSFKRVSVEEFQPATIGDEVVGFNTVMSDAEDFTGFTWRDTTFLFRVGPVVCLAKATSLNDKTPAARALATARILDRRVEDVLVTASS